MTAAVVVAVVRARCCCCHNCCCARCYLQNAVSLLAVLPEMPALLSVLPLLALLSAVPVCCLCCLFDACVACVACLLPVLPVLPLLLAVCLRYLCCALLCPLPVLCYAMLGSLLRWQHTAACLYATLLHVCFYCAGSVHTFGVLAGLTSSSSSDFAACCD